MPARILDLFAEFRCLTSGLRTPNGSGLLGALTYFGLGGNTAAEKDSMHELVMRGGPYSADEQQAVLDYCQTGLDALAKLLLAMLPMINVPRALYRPTPDEAEDFNYEVCWVRFKQPIANLVGYLRRDNCDPRLKTNAAYDVASWKLWHALHA